MAVGAWVLLLLANALGGGAIQRVYNIAIVEQVWDYCPSARNLIRDDGGKSDRFLRVSESPPRLGCKYTKAMYRECTDATCQKLKDHPKWLGLTGPIIHAEIDDQIQVNFFNKASYNYTIHPHGVFYNKNAEGARYNDGTSGSNKSDDMVPPNTRYTYNWDVRREYGPTRDDPSCITWLYHSHDEAEEEIESGAVGIIITCKQGTLDANNKRLDDIDKEYAFVLAGYDENFSHYLEQNLKAILPSVTSEDIVQNYEEFQQTNIKYGINGYIFGNLPDFSACVGDRISLHLAVVGADFDLQSVYIQGQTMQMYKQRQSTIALSPGITYTATMEAGAPGKWLMTTQSFDHYRGGMQGLFAVDNCYGGSPWKSLYGQTRTYYIAAEEIDDWNYAPSGTDTFNGNSLQSDQFAKTYFGKTKCGLQGVYKKAVYRGYQDSSFRDRIRHDRSLGILGPVICAEVGDTISVTFYNKATRPYSIQPFRYAVDKANEGMAYNDGFHNGDWNPAAEVKPGAKFTYEWTVPESVAPTRYDDDCLLGRYFSAVDPIRDTYTGLTGPLLLCKPGTLRSNGWKKGHNSRDLFLMFSVINENLNHYLNDSLSRINCNWEEANQQPGFELSNMMSSINGYSYGNIPDLTMCLKENVNLYMMSVGTTNRTDLHVPYFHGNTFSMHGHATDNLFLFSGSFQSAKMTPDNPGTWSIVDRVFGKYLQGLKGNYTVKKCRDRAASDPYAKRKVRSYYIAAVEECHNYVPIDRHPITDLPLDADSTSKLYAVRTDTQIGGIYKKVMYRAYTDGKFTKQIPRAPEEDHLGILGPFIRAEVGEIIKVVFKNLANISNRHFSIQPGLVLYDKSNEGSNYMKGPRGGVAPGATFTYRWYVPKRSGPGRDDFNCLSSIYSSDVDFQNDSFSGLVGPLIICKQGTLTRTGKRGDVDHEFALLFMIINENLSWLIESNIKKFIKEENRAKMPLESNVKLAINGQLYAGVCGVNIKQGNKAAFYVMSMGGPFDTHTVHWHGNTFIRLLNGRHRHDVIDLYPGQSETVELLGVNPGTWLMHCHVNNHSLTGMEMVYHVISPLDPTTKPPSCEFPPLDC